MRRASGESRQAALIPECNGGIVVLTFVPANDSAGGIFVRGYPAEVLKGYLDATGKDDGVADMPPVSAGMAADNTPLVEIGDAEIWSAVYFEPPGAEEVILGSSAPDRRFFFAVDVYFLIAFAEP